MAENLFDGILPHRNIGHAHQRRFQPLAQQPAAHGGLRLVQNRQERALAAAVADVLRNFEMAQAGSVDDQAALVVNTFQRVDMADIGLHDFADIGQEHADAGRCSLRFLYRFRPKIPDCDRFVVGGIVSGKGRHCALGQPAAQISLDGVHVFVHMGVYELARLIYRKNIKQHVVHGAGVAQGPQAFACRHVHQGDGNRRVARADAADIVVLLRGYGVFQGNRPRRDDLDDLALDDALDRLRILHLLADRHFVALVDQPLDIGVGRVEGHAAHGNPLLISDAPSGQRQIQFPRCRQSVVVKHFIKIAKPEKQYLIRTLSLDLQILLKHRSQLYCISQRAASLMN